MMIRKASVCLAILLLAVVVFVALPAKVSAMLDPDTPLQVSAVYVYRDCLEANDVGVLVDYYIDYATLPADTAADAYLVTFVDDDTTTPLRSAAPYVFVDSGYGRGLVWIYFSAADAATYVLDAGNVALYRVWLSGNPTVPSGWPGAPPKTVTTITSWQTTGVTAVLVARQVLSYANTLELAWGQDMIQETPLGSKLTALGESYFDNVIPNLRTIAPAVYASGTISPTDAGLDYTSFGATMTNGPIGTVFGSTITFAPPTLSGVADAGTNVTLDDAILTQADDYWNGARLTIINTTDGLAPKGETAVITDFVAANDRLTFAALTAAITAGDTYVLCSGEYGTADAGTVTTLSDSILTQADDYWNGARLVIVTTTDGAAPQGETAVITDFTALTNRLTFAALTAAVNAGDTYTLGVINVNVTLAGTFTIVLAKGTAGTIRNNGGTVTGSPVSLTPGTTTIAVTGAGLLTIVLDLRDTQAKIMDAITGTAFDLSGAAAAFNMPTMWFSGLVWLVVTILICAAVYKVTSGTDTVMGGMGAGKIVLLIFDVCIIGGAILGLLSMIMAVMMFLMFGLFIGYVVFFRNANV